MSRVVIFHNEHMLQTRVETKITTTSSNDKNDAGLEVELDDNKKIIESDVGHSEKLHSSSEIEIYQLTRDRERRIIKMPKKYGIIDLISYAPMMVDEVIGKNLKATNMHE